MNRRVVMFSGGISSWAAARRVADEHGTDSLTLLFADTRAEDSDLYRFLDDAASNIGVPVTRIADGRTPQQVFADKRFLGNSRIAPCSHLLKQVPCRRWLETNTDPATATLYVGIDWTEMHRLPAIRRGWAPWTVEAPLCEPPYQDKHQWIAGAREAGLIEPRLYSMGFPHNNCGGGCVRAGQAQWAHLLQVFPFRFHHWEENEERMRATLGADVAILRERGGGESKPLTLASLRQRIEARAEANPMLDVDDWGGCGCFVDAEETDR